MAQGMNVDEAMPAMALDAMPDPVADAEIMDTAEDEAGSRSGILPDVAIQTLHDRGAIRTPRPFDSNQIQPASLDLRLGTVAHRVRASFLPGPDRAVSERLDALTLHQVSLEGGAVLEVGCVYVVPLLEALALPEALTAAANPKSSTGRLDLFTRVIADRAREFDAIPAGYEGPLYLEISPRTFPVLVRTGSRLSQIRFRQSYAPLGVEALRGLHDQARLVSDAEANITAEGIAVSVDLEPRANGLVGYRGKHHTGVVDVDAPGAHRVSDFWEPLTPNGVKGLILDPDEFYILASREAVHVPPTHAAEMRPFDPLVGEFRVHYAGFFDPGFGHGASGTGARAVLEVRSREVPFLLEHAQTVGRLVYEPMQAPPRSLYGSVPGSNYQKQGLKLSKHFRD